MMVPAKEPSFQASRRFLQIIRILKKHHITEGIDPIKLRCILEELGPTFVKIGQVMSTRQDIFSKRYCDELKKLREEMEPLPLSTIQQVIEEAYQKPMEEVFASFCEVPLGSASIAQVHHGQTINHQNVVVKVQRPHIYELMQRDIALIEKAEKVLKVSKRLGNVVDLHMVIQEFWQAAQEEMDFRKEAAYAKQFAENHKQIEYIATPYIVDAYTSAKVLVMEYIDGIPLYDIDTLQKEGYDTTEIAAKLADNYIKQIIEDGFFHADPHPGNLRIRDGKIVWIDFGMMGQLSNKDRNMLKQAIWAIANADARKLSDVVMVLGVMQSKVDYLSLYQDIDVLMQRYLTMDLGDIDVGVAIQELFNVAHKHHIAMPKGISMLAKALITMESTIAALDPKTNLIQIATAHLQTSFIEKLKEKKLLLQQSKRLFQAGEHMVELPVQLSDVLGSMAKGQFKVNLEIKDSKEPLSMIDEIVNKMIVTLIAASLLIGSSLICTTNMEPKVLGIPFLGFMGYIGAVILGIWILFHAHIMKRK